MKIKRIQITHELLTQALQLPAGAVIADIRSTAELGAYEMKVVSDSFNEVLEGQTIPLSVPILRETGDKISKVVWEFP